MKQFDIYKNYGVLTAEKRAVYTVGGPSSTAKCYDKLAVEAPAGWAFWRDEAGTLGATTPDGRDYLVRDILCGDTHPTLRYWTPETGDCFVELRVVSVEEH